MVQPHHHGRSRFISPSDPAGLRMTSRSGQPGCTPPPGPIGRHAVSHPSAGRHRRRGPHRVAGQPRPRARPRLPGHRPRGRRHRPARRLRPPRCRTLPRAAPPPTGPAGPGPARCRAARGLRCGPDLGVPGAAGGRCRRPVARHGHRGLRPPCRCPALPRAGGRARDPAGRGQPRPTGRAPSGRHPHGHAGRRSRPAGRRAARGRGGHVVDLLDAHRCCVRPGRGRPRPGQPRPRRDQAVGASTAQQDPPARPVGRDPRDPRRRRSRGGPGPLVAGRDRGVRDGGRRRPRRPARHRRAPAPGGFSGCPHPPDDARRPHGHRQQDAVLPPAHRRAHRRSAVLGGADRPRRVQAGQRRARAPRRRRTAGGSGQQADAGGAGRRPRRPVRR